MNSLKTKGRAKKRVTKKVPAKSLKTLLLKGPVMSDAQFQSFMKTREQFEIWKGK